MWFTKANRVWEKLPDDEIIRRLTPREGKIDMVLDTDTFNEVDDQFALAYCLLSPERLNVQAVYAAPFYNDRSTGPEDGMEKSYGEIVRLLGKMGRAPEGLVYKGSRAYLPEANTPVDSPAARDLVARAMARDEADPLYVCAIGAITNVASAILMESGLSFLGLGAQPPIPSWGGIIRDHYMYMVMGKPYLALVPGTMIMLLVLAFMTFGNTLRDALDVKS